MSYQKRAAPFQSMVKRADGSAFSSPDVNGLQSFTNPMVPQAKPTFSFDPQSFFWWLKQSQMPGQGGGGLPYNPNRYLNR